MSQLACPVCELAMLGPDRRARFRCGRCGMFAAGADEATPALVGASDAMVLDETARARGLETVRRRNFERVADVLGSLRSSRGARLLDVGFGAGAFLDVARARGFDVTGVECEAECVVRARARGHAVVQGTYPSALPRDAEFDVIAFHDVFEHLDDPRAGVQTARQSLAAGGLAVVNIPSCHGALFRTARALDACGVHGPLDRLWQRGFPSPHRTYFHPDALCRLWELEGFRERHREPLETLSRDGLWSRIRFGGMGVAGAAAVWSALVIGSGFLAVAPPDITLHVFERLS